MKKESALAAYNKKYKEFQKKLRKFEMCLRIKAEEHVQDPDNWGYLCVLNTQMIRCPAEFADIQHRLMKNRMVFEGVG